MWQRQHEPASATSTLAGAGAFNAQAHFFAGPIAVEAVCDACRRLRDLLLP